VQLTPAVKVAGSVVVADPARDFAVFRIDPKALAFSATRAVAALRKAKSEQVDRNIPA